MKRLLDEGDINALSEYIRLTRLLPSSEGVNRIELLTMLSDVKDELERRGVALLVRS